MLNNLQKIATGEIDPIGPITREVAAQAEQSTFLGAQLSDKFIGAETLTTKIVALLLIILMSATTFTTQRQLMMKNMPASALDNPFAKQQKMLLYLMPLFFAISGVNFPIGVLLYWTTTNIWSMCQQFYVIRRMPAPGSLAEKALQERRAKRGKPVEEFTVKGLDGARVRLSRTRRRPPASASSRSGTRSARPPPRGRPGKPAPETKPTPSADN